MSATIFSREREWREKDSVSYYLYYYKTVDCKNCQAPPSKVKHQHNDKMCDEKGDEMGGRRNPLVYNYSHEICINVNPSRQGVPSAFTDPRKCPKGRACDKCHTFRERWYHPVVYKAEKCAQYHLHGQICRNGQRCTRYHNLEEIRDTEKSTKSWQKLRGKYKALEGKIANPVKRSKVAIFGPKSVLTKVAKPATKPLRPAPLNWASGLKKSEKSTNGMNGVTPHQPPHPSSSAAPRQPQPQQQQQLQQQQQQQQPPQLRPQKQQQLTDFMREETDSKTSEGLLSPSGIPPTPIAPPVATHKPHQKQPIQPQQQQPLQVPQQPRQQPQRAFSNIIGSSKTMQQEPSPPTLKNLILSPQNSHSLFENPLESQLSPRPKPNLKQKPLPSLAIPIPVRAPDITAPMRPTQPVRDEFASNPPISTSIPDIMPPPETVFSNSMVLPPLQHQIPATDHQPQGEIGHSIAASVLGFVDESLGPNSLSISQTLATRFNASSLMSPQTTKPNQPNQRQQDQPQQPPTKSEKEEEVRLRKRIKKLKKLNQDLNVQLEVGKEKEINAKMTQTFQDEEQEKSSQHSVHLYQRRQILRNLMASQNQLRERLKCERCRENERNVCLCPCGHAYCQSCGIDLAGRLCHLCAAVVKHVQVMRYTI